jgi:hypothetical protein
MGHSEGSSRRASIWMHHNCQAPREPGAPLRVDLGQQRQVLDLYPCPSNLWAITDDGRVSIVSPPNSARRCRFIWLLCRGGVPPDSKSASSSRILLQYTCLLLIICLICLYLSPRFLVTVYESLVWLMAQTMRLDRLVVASKISLELQILTEEIE